jgi:hypothetical protein
LIIETSTKLLLGRQTISISFCLCGYPLLHNIKNSS